MKLFANVSDFPTAMVAACNAAIDAGIVKFDAFTASVLAGMGGPDCNAVLLEVAELDRTSKDFHTARRQLNGRLGEAISAAPRGHYAVIRTKEAEGSYSFRTVVSGGYGERVAGCCAIASSVDGTQPTAEDVLYTLMEFEIYKCRMAVDSERQRNGCTTQLDPAQTVLAVQQRSQIPVATMRFAG